jgi:hypothetical protein
MSLVELVKILKTAPPTQIDPPIREMIEKVDLTSETAVREMLAEVYKSGFYASVTPFVARLCDPAFTKDYPLN